MALVSVALVIVLLCRINAQDVYPESQSATAGDIVLFQCIYQDYTPVWIINNRELSRNNLPVGHWVNSSGLVVQARPELNGTIYKCVPITIDIDGNNLLQVRKEVSISAVSLIVTSSGGTSVNTNYRKGIVVTSVVYDSATDSLLIDWNPKGSFYQLHISSCARSFWLQSQRESCAPALIDGMARSFGNNSITIDVRSCDHESKCEFNPPQGAIVDQQTLVKLEMNNTDLIPRELPDQMFEPNMLIFQSKLWVHCTRTELRIAAFTATTRVNFTVAELTDFDNDRFLSAEFIAPDGIEIKTAPMLIAQDSIQALFGQSVSEINIQEYCTESTSCDGRLTTTFGDRIKLMMSPNQVDPQPCTYTVEDILRSPTPTFVPPEMMPTSTPAVIRPMTPTPVFSVIPTRGTASVLPLSLGAIIGLVLVLVILIAICLAVPVAAFGIARWRKRRKSGNALDAGIKLYDQPLPLRSSFRRSLPGTPKLSSPSRQSMVCESPISPTYSTYFGRPLANGDAKNQQYQIVAFVEGPQAALHSPQGSISFGGHSRNPSSVAPMDRHRQFSDSPTGTNTEPQTPDYITQMKIPDLNLKEPVRRYVPVDLLPAAFSDSLASTPVPMHDQDGNQLPPRPGAPPPMSIPSPMLQNGMAMDYDRDRPNSAQQMAQAPPYFNPPSYPNQQWSATLPRLGRPPQSNLATINNAATRSDEDRIWNVV